MIIEEASLIADQDKQITDKSILDENRLKIECAICSEPINNLKKLHCGHAFHMFCAAKWLEKGNKSCPLCRSEIKSYNTVFRRGNQQSSSNSQQTSGSVNVLQIVIRIPQFVSRLIPTFNLRVAE